MNTRWLLPMIFCTLLALIFSTTLYAQDAAPSAEEAAETTAADEPTPEVPDTLEPPEKPAQQPASAPKYPTDEAVEEIRSHADRVISWSGIIMAIAGALFTAIVVILLVRSIFEAARIKREITEAIQEGRESAREAKQDVIHLLGDVRETLNQARGTQKDAAQLADRGRDIINEMRKQLSDADLKLQEADKHLAEIGEMKKAVEKDTKRAEAAAVSTEKKFDATSEFVEGLSAYERQDYDGAIAAYTKAIDIDPTSPVLWHNRGAAKSEKGEHDGAIADLSEAIRLRPDDAVTWYNRGNTKTKKGDSDGAIADHDEAIRLKPDLVYAWMSRAVAKRNKGDLDGAILDCDEAMRLAPDLAGPRRSKLVTLFSFCDRARCQEAEEFLKESWPFMKTDEDKLTTEYIAAFIFTLLGKGSEAKKARGNMTNLLDKGMRDLYMNTVSFVNLVKECKLLTAKQRTFLREVNKEWLAVHEKK